MAVLLAQLRDQVSTLFFRFLLFRLVLLDGCWMKRSQSYSSGLAAALGDSCRNRCSWRGPSVGEWTGGADVVTMTTPYFPMQE